MGRAKGQNNAIDMSTFNDVFGRTRGSINFSEIPWDTLMGQVREQFTGHMLEEVQTRLSNGDITNEQFSDFLRLLENHDDFENVKKRLTMTNLDDFISERLPRSLYGPGVQHALIFIRLQDLPNKTMRTLEKATLPKTPGGKQFTLSLLNKENRKELIAAMDTHREALKRPLRYLDFHVGDASFQDRQTAWDFLAELRQNKDAYEAVGQPLFKALYDKEIVKDQLKYMNPAMAASFAQIVQAASDKPAFWADEKYAGLVTAIAEEMSSLRDKGLKPRSSETRKAVGAVLSGSTDNEDMSQELKRLINQCGVNASLVLQDNLEEAFSSLGLEYNPAVEKHRLHINAVRMMYNSAEGNKEKYIAKTFNSMAHLLIAEAVQRALYKDAPAVEPSHPLYRRTPAGGSRVNWTMETEAIKHAAEWMRSFHNPQNIEEVSFFPEPMLKQLADLDE